MKKKPLLTACFISVFLILAAFGAQFDVGYATETPADVEEVLVFLRDVMQLDMTKYEAMLKTTGTLGTQTTGQYRLDSTGFLISPDQCGKSILTVSFTFMDEEFISCSIYENSQGPPYYSEQPATNLKDIAADILQRYQTYTGDSQLAQMMSLLDTVDLASNTTKAIGSLELEVSVKRDRTHLTWGNMFNGADYSRLILDFEGTELSYFYDNRNFYRLGSTEVNISQQQAESIAIERVEKEKYKPIREELLRSYPSFLYRGDFREKFACWIVEVPLRLTDPRPGHVTYFVVMIWADSGEVVSCEGLGAAVPFSPETAATPEPTATPTTSPSAGSSNTDLIPTERTLALIASVVIISASLLAYFKKRKQ